MKTNLLLLAKVFLATLMITILPFQERGLSARDFRVTSSPNNDDQEGSQAKSRIGCGGVLGFLIRSVNAEDAAGRAGLKEGDLVTGLNGRQITSLEDFQGQILRSSPGTSFDLECLRYNPATKNLDEFSATLKTRPIAATGASSRIGAAGLFVFIVKTVNAEDAAGRAGLKEGDLVTGLNGRQITSLEDFQGQILRSSPGTSFDLECLRYNPATKNLDEFSATLKTRPIAAFSPGSDTRMGRHITQTGLLIKTATSSSSLPKRNTFSFDCTEGCCEFCRNGAPPCMTGSRFTGKAFCNTDWRSGLCPFTFCV